MMYWYGNGMGGWGYALMTFSTVLFWAVVLIGLIVLFRYFTGRQHGPGSSLPSRPTQEQSRPTPEQLLAERFARGEIDENEFLHGLNTLRQHHSPTPGSSTPGGP